MAKLYDGPLYDTMAAFKEAGIDVDPNTVLRDGVTEEGYEVFIGDFRLGREFVPWPDPEVGLHLHDVWRHETLYGPRKALNFEV